MIDAFTHGPLVCCLQGIDTLIEMLAALPDTDRTPNDKVGACAEIPGRAVLLGCQAWRDAAGCPGRSISEAGHANRGRVPCASPARACNQIRINSRVVVITCCSQVVVITCRQVVITCRQVIITCRQVVITCRQVVITCRQVVITCVMARSLL